MMPFAVMTVEKFIDVYVSGYKKEMPLSYADGMVGAMPVFETREQAENFSGGKYDVMELLVLKEKEMKHNAELSGALKRQQETSGASPRPLGRRVGGRRS